MPSITQYEQENLRLIAQVQNLQKENLELKERSAITFVHEVVDFEAVRERILFELKLGRQASGYKAVQKALNRFIQDIKLMVDSFWLVSKLLQEVAHSFSKLIGFYRFLMWRNISPTVS